MRVFLAGASGVIGRALILALVDGGHQVTGMTRQAERVGALRVLGADPVVCDVFDEAGLTEAVKVARPDAVVHQLTAIPRRMDPRRIKELMEPTNRLRIEGTKHLIAAAVAAGARRFVTQSIAFVYAPRYESLADENEPLYYDAPDPFVPVIHAVAECEQTALSTAGIRGTVLRYGFFYGPGMIYAADGSFSDDVNRKRVPIVGEGGGVFSFIHVDDAANATRAALEQDADGVFNIVDDDPAPVRDWLPRLAEELGAAAPGRAPAWLARLGAGDYAVYLMTEQRGAANDKAKQRLGWQPAHPTWRAGFLS